MAERPSELNEQTSASVDENTDVALTTERSGDSYLTKSSDETYSSDRESDKETSTDETSDDAEQIRASIEETRAGMGETIDAIQEKLSYEHISGQVKDEVSEYVSETIQTVKNTIIDVTIGKAGNIMNYVNKGINEIADTKLAKTVGRNPLPLALIGLGVGGLLVYSFQKKKPNYRSRRGYDKDNQDYERVYSSKQNKSMLTTAQDTVSGAAGKVSETVGNVAGAVSDTVGGVASKAYKQVGNFGSQAQDLAGTAQEQYEYYMDENPLAVGAVALALGAAVGLAIPSTRVENQWMGETRDNLVQQARETANDAVEKVQEVAGQVAEQVTETVKEKAKNQGLT